MQDTHHQYINQRFKEVNELIPKQPLTPILDMSHIKPIMNGNPGFIKPGSNSLLFINHTHTDTDYFKYDYHDITTIPAIPSIDTDPVDVPDASY
jgi:hypothetical protein